MNENRQEMYIKLKLSLDRQIGKNEREALHLCATLKNERFYENQKIKKISS